MGRYTLLAGVLTQALALSQALALGQPLPALPSPVTSLLPDPTNEPVLGPFDYDYKEDVKAQAMLVQNTSPEPVMLPPRDPLAE